MKTKQNYNRPRMRVVELKGRQRILAGSGQKASMNVSYEEEDI